MKISESPALKGLGQRRVRFYITNPAPCPYLDGQTERKVFTNLAVEDAQSLHDALSHGGFRRSQSIAYRPACASCKACMAARVPVSEFKFTKRWRRVLNKNKELVRTAVRPSATREQYRLLKTYLDSRHAEGGMAGMELRDFVSMVEGSPVPTVIFEYRAGDADDAPLMAAALVDVLKDGLSMVYSFFDPSLADRGMGNFMILDQIRYAQELGLDYVYLGYWVEGSPKMDYKAAFRPIEVLDAEEWRRLEDE
ncbi:arginyltransferase [Ponticaulis sp.]|uniref:arginyltransferase n=1 Tax=Ponticaulis sp. TaxID=2020902 RepID=UPI002636A1C1|nr:arginyltransferase [Ponticaulis sp.]MDF1681741.1 arginyltransferase [Ponticaulis sp.]